MTMNYRTANVYALAAIGAMMMRLRMGGAT